MLGMLFNKHKAKPGAPARKRGKRRLVEIGWLLDANQATFVYNAPRPIARKGPPAASAEPSMPPSLRPWRGRRPVSRCSVARTMPSAWTGAAPRTAITATFQLSAPWAP